MITSAIHGHSEVVALLCRRGANIEAQDNVSIIESLEFMYSMQNRLYTFVYSIHDSEMSSKFMHVQYVRMNYILDMNLCLVLTLCLR